ACGDFLEAPAEELDIGYSSWLQKEAKSRGSEADAVTFLMSAAVQEEVATIARAMLMTSLGVERKRAADERNEASRLITIGRASRNAILRQYMAWKETAMGAPKRPVKQVKQRTNPRAVALSWNPGLVTAVPSESGKRPPALFVDEEALAAYMAVNRAALEAEVQRRRQTALRPLSTNGQFPVSNRERLTWLKENEEAYRRFQTTAGSARSSASQRIAPDREYPACARLQPVSDEPPVAWRHLLSAWAPGFFCIQAGATKWVVFHVSRGKRSLVVPLHAEGGTWELVLTTSMCDQYLDVYEFCVRFGVPSAAVDLVSVYRLGPRLECSYPGKMLSFRFPMAYLVDAGDLPRKARRESDAEASDSDEVEGAPSDDSDIQSLASEADPGAESEAEGVDIAEAAGGAAEEAEEAGGGEDDDEAHANAERERVEGHPFVIWTNGFFTLSDNPKWGDIKIRALPRWCVEGLMGENIRGDPTRQMPKAVAPAHFHEPRDRPSRSRAVLRAWALWRARQRGFAEGSAYRRRVFDLELGKLRDELAALGHGGRAGDADADAWIEAWAPEALA
ncbi:unnamed protein product, partial [Prorocentrum cordatum]